MFSINVAAASYEYHISPGDNFTSAQYGDDLTEISEKLNMTADELNTYFNKNGLLYLAVSDDTKTQIRISSFTDNFSSAAGDMSRIDDQTLAEFLVVVSKDGENTTQVISSNDRKFIRVKNTLKDSGGIYTVTQYITICNNKTFYFAGYNAGEETSDDITTAFKSFTLREKLLDTPNYTLRKAFIIVGVTVFSALAIFIIISIIKSYQDTRTVEVMENEN